jgi:hypothetical protein
LACEARDSDCDHRVMTVLGGGGWWLSDAYRPDDLARTVASIPPARHVPPAWLEDQVPTISATLVGVSSAEPSAAEPPVEAAPGGHARDRHRYGRQSLAFYRGKSEVGSQKSDLLGPTSKFRAV